MSSPQFVIGQQVRHSLDASLGGKIIAIHRCDEPYAPYHGVWTYLVLLKQPSPFTQTWFVEDKMRGIDNG